MYSRINGGGILRLELIGGGFLGLEYLGYMQKFLSVGERGGKVRLI